MFTKTNLGVNVQYKKQRLKIKMLTICLYEFQLKTVEGSNYSDCDIEFIIKKQ